MSFGPDRLLTVLQTLPHTPCYWVGYSGGLDSQVLLHAMSLLRGRYPASLRAIHVDHGLHPDAGLWRAHCARYCERRNIPLIEVAVRVRPARGESLEALARDLRYRAIGERMGAEDLLLTAHHQDDQAETVLLQLLRGSGPSGLAGMPVVNRFDPGWLGRPLLGVSRQALLSYAQAAKLQWVDDSSNLNTDFDRNFLRHQVLPLLRTRWPALNTTLCRSARHCGDAQGLIDEQAANDRLLVATGQKHVLSVSELCELPAPRCRAVLRHWFRELGLPLPNTVHLDRIGSEVLVAAHDRMPQVSWSGTEVRRYRNGLYAMRTQAPHNASQRLVWKGDAKVELPSALGNLRKTERLGQGIDLTRWTESRISVGFRSGGERCHPVGRGHTHSLKKLFQERGVPPWERDRIPLLFLDDRLAAVVGLWICEPFQASQGNPGIDVVWTRQPGLEFSANRWGWHPHRYP